MLSTSPASRPDPLDRVEVEFASDPGRLLRPGDPQPAGRRERRGRARGNRRSSSARRVTNATTTSTSAARAAQERHAARDRREALRARRRTRRARSVRCTRAPSRDAELPPQRRPRVVLVVRPPPGPGLVIRPAPARPGYAFGRSPHGHRVGPSNAMDRCAVRRRNADREPRGRIAARAGDAGRRSTSSRPRTRAGPGRLLQGFGVKTKLVSLFDGNETERTRRAAARVSGGRVPSRSCRTAGCRSSPIPGTAW